MSDDCENSYDEPAKPVSKKQKGHEGTDKAKNKRGATYYQLYLTHVVPDIPIAFVVHQ